MSSRWFSSSVPSALLLASGMLSACGATPESDETAVTFGAAVSGRYALKAVHSGKCVDVAGGVTATQNGANVQQWTCGNNTNQQWDITQCSDGTHLLKAVHSGRFMNVYGGSTPPTGSDNGANVQQYGSYSCSSTAKNVRFKFISKGNGEYQLQAQHSLKCVDVSGGVNAVEDGRNIHQWGCHENDNQRFTLQPVGSGGDPEPEPEPDPGGSLPSGWSNRDIGSVAASGSASYSNGTFTVRGSGADIWGGADEFQFAYRQFSGDGTITARVAGIQNTNGWAKAGVMFRESLSAGSKHALMALSASNGLAFQRRTSTGGTSSNTSGGSGTWVRLSRSGSTLTGYKSSDGSSWSTVGSATVSMASSLYVGLAVSSHADGTLNTSSFSNVSVTTGGGGGGGGSGFAALVSESQFNSWFPNRNSTYSYAGLVEATNKYPAFCNTGDTTIKKREAAALLAHVKHETGSLVYTRQIQRDPYCSSSSGCSCNPNDTSHWYYGRGSLQLSWNYNYCAAGSALGVDLHGSPDLVATTGWLAWGTGLWFFMTQTGAGSYTMHDSIVNNRGFGQTIRTINGALECNGGNPNAVSLRVGYYKDFCTKLGVTPGDNLTC